MRIPFWRSWLVMAALVGIAPGADWPQFLGPNRDCSTSEKNLVARLSANAAPVTWRKPVGAGYSGPVVVGPNLYLFHFEKGEERLACFDVETGVERWHAGYACDFDGGMFHELGPRSTPCCAGDYAVTFGSNGMVQCVLRAGGVVAWRRDLFKDHPPPESYFGAACSPVVWKGRVLINLGAKGAGFIALDLLTGKTLWKTTDEGASYASPRIANLAGVDVALFFARSGLHGIDPASGDTRFFVRWRARLDASVNAASPQLRGDEIFISSSYGVGGGVFKPAAPNGLEKVWADAETLACHYDTPARAGEYLYGIDGRQEGGAQLRCVRWADGAVQWTQPGYGCAAAILADQRLWFLRESGTLEAVAVDPVRYVSHGELKILAAPVRAHPALANGSFYARDKSELVRVDLRAKP
jgi:outer membrane protein assembly factor BamB